MPMLGTTEDENGPVAAGFSPRVHVIATRVLGNEDAQPKGCGYIFISVPQAARRHHRP